MCPPSLLKGHVYTTAVLDREKERLHSCIVKVVDPGNPSFSSMSDFEVIVSDVNDCAPKLKYESLALNNAVNETLDVEFVDEDEGDDEIEITMTEGFEYFALIEDDDGDETNIIRRRRKRALSRRAPAGSPPAMKLRQTKKLPNEFKAMAFRACDGAGNCGASELPVTFPEQFIADGNTHFLRLT